MRTVAYLAGCIILGVAFVYVGVRLSMWLDGVEQAQYDRQFAELVERMER